MAFDLTKMMTLNGLYPVDLGLQLVNGLALSHLTRGGQASLFLNSAQLGRVQKVGGLPTPTPDYYTGF